MKKSILTIAFASLILLACDNTNNTNTCTTASGTELCFDGKTYQFNTVFWEKEYDHIEIQLEPNVTGPGDYAAIYFFLMGTTIQTDTLPHIGTYTSIPFATPSTGSMDFSGWLQTISGGNITSYDYVQDDANTLSITDFSSNMVSGNGSFKVKNLTTNNISTAVFSFEDLPFQP